LLASTLYLVLFLRILIPYQAITDSLEIRLNDLKASQKVDLLIKISKKYWRTNPPKSLKLSERAYKLARQLNYAKGIGDALNTLGVNNAITGNFDKALEYLHKSLRIRDSLGDQRGISNIYHDLGIVYSNLGKINKSIQFNLKSLDINKSLKDSLLIGKSLSNLGNNYWALGDYDKALKYYKDALVMHEKQKSKLGIAQQLNNIGLTYYAENQLKEALKYYRQALKIREEINDRYGIAYSLNNIGIIYGKLKNYDVAKKYLFEGLTIAGNIKSVEQSKVILSSLLKLYKAKGDYKNAFKYLLAYSELQDSLARKINSSKTSNYMNLFQRELEKKNNELARKNNELNKEIISRQKALIALIIIGSLLLIALVIVLYSSNIHRKKINDKLRELNASKDKFFSIIGHDLRQPFNSILGYTNLLIDEFDELSTDEKKLYLTSIKNSADNSFKLLDNLLQWARLQAGRIEINKEIIDPNYLIKSSVKLLSGIADEKNITIETNLEENLTAYADESMVAMIIRNLITNAIKFTNPGGKIKITSSSHNKSIIVSVEDNGVGISKEDLANLFKIDVQHSALGTNKEKGTGLGLILVKEFLQKNNGKIRVVSELGKGSLFSFSLPRKNP